MEQIMVEKIIITKEDLESKILEGLDNESLASYFNCSKRTINYRKAKFGLQQLRFLTQVEITSIQEDYANNVTIESLMSKYNVSESTIRRYLPIISNVEKIVKDKNCPYCNKLFVSWKSVRGHVSSCFKKDESFIISCIYGPILIKELQGTTFKQIKSKYPNIEKSILSYISKTLRNQGFSTSVRWTKETAKQAMLDYYKKHNSVPTARDTYGNPELPSDTWVKETFTLWNSFIEYCGFTPNENGYGTLIKFNDGNSYRSKLEVYFVENYLVDKFVYVYEKPYPGNTTRISDFYLPDFDIYIEIAGGLRPEVIKEKIKFCVDNNLKLLVLYPRNIYSGNINLQDRINEVMS
jgi:hypothetical protein